MKNSLAILLLCVCFNSVAQNKVWTLEECVSHALENNISIKRGKNTLLLNEQDIKAAKGNFLPGLSANASQGLSLGTSLVAEGLFVNRTSHSTNFGVSVSQNVFNGFRNTYLYKQSQLNLETNELELNRIRDDISLNVVNEYLNILFNIENLGIAKAQYAFSEKQLQQVKDLVEAGVQPRANIFDTEATLSSDAQSVTIAENSYTLSLLSLSQLLQVPFQGFRIEIIEIDRPSKSIMHKDIAPILNYALENRNEIKVAKKNIENAELGTKISKSGYYPNLSLGYGFNTNAFFSNLATNEASLFNQLSDNKGHSFNLNLSIPIFSRFQNKTAVAKSRIQEEDSKLGLEQVKLDLEINIQRAYTDAQAALKAYAAAQKSLDSQKLSFNNSQERYNLGALNSFNLEQARIRLINAESSLINAKYDFVFKTKVLDFYLGRAIIF